MVCGRREMRDEAGQPWDDPEQGFGNPPPPPRLMPRPTPRSPSLSHVGLLSVL